VGVGWLLEATGAVEVPWGALIPGGLILVGLALVVGSARGQKTGGLVGIGVALAVVAGLFTLVDVPLNSGVGDRTARPATVEELERSYELAVGELTVDLRQLDLGSGTTRVEAHVAIGQVRVIVPEGVPLLVQGEAGVGSVQLLDRSADGFVAETVFRDRDYGGAAGRLQIEVSVGMGEVEVRR
jgi:Cell wall-active antibiotics response 4TMS YvqF